MKTSLKSIFAVAVGLILVLSILTATGFTAQASMFNSKVLKDHLTEQPLAEPAKVNSEILSKVSLPFIENLGQTDNKVKFYANTFAGTVFVTNEGLTYSIPDPSNEGSSAKETRTYSVIQEDFAGKELKISGVQKSSAGVSYFIGNSKKDWYTDIPTYDTLSLGTLYPGINLDLKAHGRNVEKVFTVSPSGDVKDIKVGVSGVQKLKVDDGKLLLYTEKGTISMTKPLAYQEIQGIKKTVDVSYTVSGRSYGFELGSYDTSLPVVIDPIIQSTYLGGSDYDEGFGIALDSLGNVYVTGFTGSTDFPGTAGGAQAAYAGAFVSKLTPDLKTITQSTYLGGSDIDLGFGIALDSLGNVYVTGFTTSTNFPGTTGGAQAASGGLSDAFVSKLTPDLKTLTQSTYLGGSGSDEGHAIALDSSGNVYVAGFTFSTNFPGTTGGAQATFGGGFTDVFVSKLTPDLRGSPTTTSISNEINQLLIAGCIDNAGVANSFTSKLSAAQKAIDAGNFKTAINISGAFINELEAQSGKHVCTAGATALTKDTQSLINSLPMSSVPNPILGWVSTSAGTGISGATVSIKDPNGNTVATSTSDVLGFYYFAEVSMLNTGTTYTVQVTGLPAGFTTSSPAFQTFTWGGTMVTLSNFVLS